MIKAKKISQLPLADSLHDTDLFVVKQSSVTKATTLLALSEYIGTGGTSARDIELRKNGEYIQWKYVGDIAWNNLVALADLQGPAGSGSLSQVSFAADGIKNIFNGISGISSTDPLKYIVTVGGVTQQPGISYTVSTENGGSLIFDEIPPANLAITVCVFQ